MNFPQAEWRTFFPRKEKKVIKKKYFCYQERKKKDTYGKGKEEEERCDTEKQYIHDSNKKTS